MTRLLFTVLTLIPAALCFLAALVLSLTNGNSVPWGAAGVLLTVIHHAGLAVLGPRLKGPEARKADQEDPGTPSQRPDA